MFYDGKFDTKNTALTLENIKKTFGGKTPFFITMNFPYELRRPDNTRNLDWFGLYDDDTRLGSIADECIGIFDDLLFTLKPVELISSGPNINSRLDSNEPNFRSKKLRCAMHNHLKAHLIMTFAYRFYCDNIPLVSLRKYYGELYPVLYDIPCDFKDDEYKIQRITKNAQTELTKKVRSFQENSISFFHDSKTYGSSTYIKGVLSRLNSFDLDSPLPDVWFRYFLIEEYSHLNKATNKIGTFSFYQKLYDNILNSQMKGLLIPDLTSRTDSISIPSRTNYIYNATQPQKRPFNKIDIFELKDIIERPPIYRRRRGYPESTRPDKAIITLQLQIAFNHFLLERYFHFSTIITGGHFVATMKYPSNSIPDTWSTAIQLMLKIRAPLMHTAMLNYCMHHFPLPEIHDEDIEKLLQLTERWNKIALPALEELFLQRVSCEFNENYDVFSSINDWICISKNFDLVTYNGVLQRATSDQGQKKKHALLSQYDFFMIAIHSFLEHLF